jgi:nucleoside-diphosphate-sugar epimerase
MTTLPTSTPISDIPANVKFNWVGERKKSIFLTGASGFIGSHLLPLLSEYDVTCGRRDELPETTPDYVIHLAGTTTTSESFFPELFDNNIVYARRIMDIPTRIIYASSTSAAELSNPYAYTKRYLEHLGTTRNATGLRFFNVYGDANNKGIVHKALHCAKTGERMILQGGYQVRDFIHVSDVCRAIVASLDSSEKLIEVGTGIGRTINEALRTIQEIAGNFEVYRTGYSKTDMMHSVAECGIEGCLNFEDGIKMVVNKI